MRLGCLGKRRGESSCPQELVTLSSTLRYSGYTDDACAHAWHGRARSPLTCTLRKCPPHVNSEPFCIKFPHVWTKPTSFNWTCGMPSDNSVLPAEQHACGHSRLLVPRQSVLLSFPFLCSLFRGASYSLSFNTSGPIYLVYKVACQ